jgi:pimeloyl-ACP methyl ester carboxylesterase
LRQVEEIEPLRASVEKHVLPQCGHSPHRDQPQATREIVAKFLARRP